VTAYVKRGDKVILYAGNLNLGALNALMETLRGEGVEVFPPIVAGREPAGAPAIVAVIEPPGCDMCGWPDNDRGRGMTVDSVIVDEVNRAPDCPDTAPHYPHTWGAGARGFYYCKGVPK